MATVQPRTPGIYIYEPNSFPPSIVGVGTAVPAFIGYTEQGSPTGDAIPVAVQINSLVEYRAKFGGAYREEFDLVEGKAPAGSRGIGTVTLGSKTYTVAENPDGQFNLYNSLVLFFANGGSQCFIVPCGAYQDSPTAKPNPITEKALNRGLLAIRDVVGPTMLVIPDAALLPDSDSFNTIAVAMLQQCLDKQDRVAILDVWIDPAAETDPNVFPEEAIGKFRTGMVAAPRQSLRYGMAYFPNIMTNVVQAADVTVAAFSKANIATISGAIDTYAKEVYPDRDGAPDPRYTQIADTYVKDLTDGKWVPDGTSPVPPGVMTATELTSALTAVLPDLSRLLATIATGQSLMPPSGAMAGLYAQNDRINGVWNAPANIGIAGALAPVINISDDQQGNLNVPVNGLSINAIRTFVGRRTLVWGARTLDGNSGDWRYIQVRRTMIFIEQSVKQALNQVVFAPNTAQTWVTVVSMVESFLHGVWSAGGLAGGSPEAAYSVQCGLGTTMTPEDVNNGVMIVQVVLTTVHPAEFIELVFKQQMMGGA